MFWLVGLVEALHVFDPSFSWHVNLFLKRNMSLLTPRFFTTVSIGELFRSKCSKFLYVSEKDPQSFFSFSEIRDGIYSLVAGIWTRSSIGNFGVNIIFLSSFILTMAVGANLDAQDPPKVFVQILSCTWNSVDFCFSTSIFLSLAASLSISDIWWSWNFR